MAPFSLDPEAIERAYAIEYDDLPMLDFSGFADLARLTTPGDPGHEAIPDPELRAGYFSALLDLHALVEEYRFHVSLAHLLVIDAAVKRERGEVEERDTQEATTEMGIPDEARALLLPYMRRTPPAVDLFLNPHQLTTGNRRFSGWIAAQMIDSALVRGVAACDRITTLLWARAGLAFPKTKTGALWLPDFTARSLHRLEPSYSERPEWREVMALLENPVNAWVKLIRNRFTHARREASELHGERAVSTVSGPTVRGMDAGTHLALGLGFYALIISPLVDQARTLLAEADSDAEPPRDRP